MGRYISLEDVRVRLIGKVKFTEDEQDENRMHVSLANRLILEAEAQVEMDLSPRYASPFQGINGEAFLKLPTNTREIIRTLCELKAVIRVLETDFGTGTAVDGDKYIRRIEDRYNKIINERVLAKVPGMEDQKQWAIPPLQGLKLNWFNTQADDGYAGMVLVSGNAFGEGAARQINDPSETFWSGVLDD